ncbi:MAG: glycosyltransferase, partial [Pseudomonadota bacterium]
FLFFSLTQAFATLLFFEQSTLAKLQRQFRRVYRLMTGQRGKNSAYEDLLEHAHAHYAEFEIAPPEAPVTKLRMANDVVRYVFRNPAGSARSFSWARLRRAAQVFLRSSPEDLAVWVKSRFPGSEVQLEAFDPATLSPELDFLQLQFPDHAGPQVSIIIPVYNDYRVTMNCLQSVLQHTSNVAYEVILADDNSSDLTATISDRVSGIRVVRSATNLRFLRNCNRAAEHARGRVLVFLNNDTAVTEGWLVRLLEPFEDPTVGTAGPKLLFADGSLQEAGGIVWEDASGWNFGRGDDPEKPAYCYRKEVDYVSGACLAVRTELWKELAGFDERFAPAYYEDADLCFAARERGYRCIYQPESVVFHFEGVSNGTDLSSGIKQHQVTNQRVFRDKWSSLLASEHFPNAEHVIHARDRSKDRYSVLIIDHYVPHPDKDAGSRSTFMYIELLLALGCRVQFMGANFFPHEPYTSRLRAMGVEVLVGEHMARNLENWLREHSPYIDEIFLHRPHVAEQFLPDLRKLPKRPPISFIGHDLHYLRMRRQAELTGQDEDFKESQRWERRELAVIEQVEKAYYFSQVELEELAQHVPQEKLYKIPLYATAVKEVPRYSPAREQSLIFVGGYNHPPNVDAANWLVDEVMPSLRERLDAPRLHLVGSNPPDAVQSLACADVTVHGYLSDAALDALYREAAVAVVPLRFGAGIKGKVIEAITQGLPLVTTTIGAEGIPEAKEVMWIADDAATFSDLLCSLLTTQDQRKAKLGRYQSWLNGHFSRSAAAQALAADRPQFLEPT